MDAFLLCLNALCLGGQAGIHLAFAARFTGRSVRARHYAAYFLLLCGAGLRPLSFAKDDRPLFVGLLFCGAPAVSPPLDRFVPASSGSLARGIYKKTLDFFRCLL